MSLLRGHKLSVAQIALIVAPSFVLFGYNQAGVGGLLSVSYEQIDPFFLAGRRNYLTCWKLPDWTKTFPEIDTTHTTGAAKSHNATIQGVVVATFVLGALIGALCCMYTGDMFGRRKNIFMAAALTLIGEILCSSSYALPQFIVGRTTIGLGTGVLSATVPVWQAECSSAANRGKHVVLDGLFITWVLVFLRQLLGVISDFLCLVWDILSSHGSILEHLKSKGHMKKHPGECHWQFPYHPPSCWCSASFSCRSPLAVCTLYARRYHLNNHLIMKIGLIKVGRVEEARVNLSKLKDDPLDSSSVIAEIESIQYSLEESAVKKANMAAMFTMGPEKLFYRFCLCIVLQFYQQMSGSNLISVYAPVIFQQNLKLDGQTSRILAGGTLTWKFLSSFVAFFTIDRFGRRALFIFSGVGWVSIFD